MDGDINLFHHGLSYPTTFSATCDLTVITRCCPLNRKWLPSRPPRKSLFWHIGWRFWWNIKRNFQILIADLASLLKVQKYECKVVSVFLSIKGKWLKICKNGWFQACCSFVVKFLTISIILITSKYKKIITTLHSYFFCKEFKSAIKI